MGGCPALRVDRSGCTCRPSTEGNLRTPDLDVASRFRSSLYSVSKLSRTSPHPDEHCLLRCSGEPPAAWVSPAAPSPPCRGRPSSSSWSTAHCGSILSSGPRRLPSPQLAWAQSEVAPGQRESKESQGTRSGCERVYVFVGTAGGREGAGRAGVPGREASCRCGLGRRWAAAKPSPPPARSLCSRS